VASESVLLCKLIGDWICRYAEEIARVAIAGQKEEAPETIILHVAIVVDLVLAGPKLSPAP